MANYSGLPYAGLPSDYQQVKYLINHSGGSGAMERYGHITTDFIPAYGDTIHAVFNIEDRDKTQNSTYLFGAGENEDESIDTEFDISLKHQWITTRAQRLNLEYYSVTTDTLNVPESTLLLDAVITLSDDNHAQLTVNETDIRESQETAVPKLTTIPLWIFSNDILLQERTPKASIFELSVERDGTTVLYLVPCYRKTDNVCGLYDTVSRTFYEADGVMYWRNEVLPPNTVLIDIEGEQTIYAGIVSGTLDLDEIITEKNVVFGQYCANKFEVSLYNIGDVSGKDIHVTQIGDDGLTTRPIFTGTIFSSKLSTHDDNARDIIAYDTFFDKKDMDVAKWWNTFWTTHENTDLKTILESFCEHIGIELSDTLNSMMNYSDIQKPKSIDSMSAVDMLKQICELGQVIPNIDRYGKLELIYLVPFPGIPYANVVGKYSKSSTFEEYTTKQLERVRVFDETGTAKGIAFRDEESENQNTYTLNNNIFLYQIAVGRAMSIANAFLFSQPAFKYKPQKLELYDSNDVRDISVGRRIFAKSEDADDVGFITEFHLSGVQLSNAEIISTGDEYFDIVDTSYSLRMDEVESVKELSESTADQVADWVWTEGDKVFIDGGKIYLDTLFSREIVAKNMNITGGSIKMSTSNDEFDYIELNSVDPDGGYSYTSTMTPSFSRIVKTHNDDNAFNEIEFRSTDQGGLLSISEGYHTADSGDRLVRSTHLSDGDLYIAGGTGSVSNGSYVQIDPALGYLIVNKDDNHYLAYSNNTLRVQHNATRYLAYTGGKIDVQYDNYLGTYSNRGVSFTNTSNAHTASLHTDSGFSHNLSATDYVTLSTNGLHAQKSDTKYLSASRANLTMQEDNNQFVDIRRPHITVQNASNKYMTIGYDGFATENSYGFYQIYDFSKRVYNNATITVSPSSVTLDTGSTLYKHQIGDGKWEVAVEFAVTFNTTGSTISSGGTLTMTTLPTGFRPNFTIPMNFIITGNAGMNVGLVARIVSGGGVQIVNTSSASITIKSSSSQTVKANFSSRFITAVN